MSEQSHPMQANVLPAARGWVWFVGGLKLWQRSPGIVGLAAMLAFLVSGLVGSLPWVGSFLICLMGPFINVFLLRVCHLVALGRKPSVQSLARDLSLAELTPAQRQQRIRGLFILGAVTFAGLMAGQGLMSLIAGDSTAQLMAASQAAMTGAAPAASSASAPLAASSAPAAAVAPVAIPLNALLALLLNLFGISVLSIIMWIAPALTAFAGVPAVKSLFFSVIACWRNKAAFLVFGLSLACLSVPLSIVMMLGGLGQTLVIMILFGIIMPACFASNYLSVTDIFGPLPEPSDAA